MMLYNDNLEHNIFKEYPFINYKHLCGEYPTSSSFALWLAANIIKQNRLPICFENETACSNNFKRILICNNYQPKEYFTHLLSSWI